MKATGTTRRNDSWLADARCVGEDPEVFFPALNEAEDNAAALRVCRGCPVTEQCLAAAFQQRCDDGVWGGTTAKERRKIARVRAGSSPAPLAPGPAVAVTA